MFIKKSSYLNHHYLKKKKRKRKKEKEKKEKKRKKKNKIKNQKTVSIFHCETEKFIVYIFNFSK
jgi:hypothetical protein